MQRARISGRRDHPVDAMFVVSPVGTSRCAVDSSAQATVPLWMARAVHRHRAEIQKVLLPPPDYAGDIEDGRKPPLEIAKWAPS